jgi:hypothetical protein
MDPTPKNVMKRNEKYQKTPKNKEYRYKRIVSVFVHYEENQNKYLISKINLCFHFLCF